MTKAEELKEEGCPRFISLVLESIFFFSQLSA